MSRNVPEKIKAKGGHQPRARIHAGWSPIGQHHRRVALLRGLGVFVAVVLVLGFAVDAYAQSFFHSLPSIRGLDTAAFAGDTLITDRNGNKLADIGYHTGDHRLAVRLKDVSPNMVNATIAIEDKNFYSNPGFDSMAILRAIYDDLRTGHIVSGASTITQQLAKQQFLTPDQTYSRKIRELALAYELSQTYTKDQILELYLNKSFYGAQSYGVEAAAQSYFHTSANKLDLAQATVLAGLPQAPTQYNPVLNPDDAKVRQKQVLDAMVHAYDVTKVTQAMADEAFAEKLTYYAPTNNALAPHFVDYVQSELRQLGFQAGVQQLNVKTTLDYNLQAQGENIVRSNLKANLYRDRTGQLSSAMVAMDPRTGEILVMVGSPDYNSHNICAVKAELSIGVPSVLNWMRNLGVNPRYLKANADGTYTSDPNAPPDEYGPSLTLGGYPITLVEHVAGISVYANMGVYHTPEAILQVTDSHGNVLYQTNADQRARLAIDPGVAYIMAQIMADDANRAPIFVFNSALHWN